MELGMRGRVALVTGGSKGIGCAIAQALAVEGVAVVVVARGGAAVDETCAKVRAAGGEALGVVADVTVATEAVKAVDAALERYGRLDILVNNAGGIAKFGALTELSSEDWTDAFRLNVLGCVNFVVAAESALLRSPAARIITVSSISGMQPGFYNPHYTTTKAATINLSKHLANVYADKGILANAVCPGPVHSDAWMQNVAQLADKTGVDVEAAYRTMEQLESRKIPLGRVGEGADVADLVVFLASDKARWITGACFHVSGGKYAAMG
ncbi:MAG: SDR family oxidoreductase [Methylococcaceae bacterium]|nr:MAG: SDR family oxidoreductase [Methylococcaceae bacterium]